VRKIHICALFLIASTLIACEQICPMVALQRNTTYNYSYSDPNSQIYHYGNFTTDANGDAEVVNVPDNINCAGIAYSIAAGDDAFDMLDPPQS
jgi:hypothetical protein